MIKKPLRYNISSWGQLTQCMSNNSTELFITVSDVVNIVPFRGTIIRVVHQNLGVLFACTVNGQGGLLSEDEDNHIYELSTEEILKVLYTFGFDVTYSTSSHLDGEQLDFLLTLQGLGFDKLRTLVVYNYTSDGQSITEHIVVAFNVTEHSDWINNGYSASYTEYIQGIEQGTAINVSALSKLHQFSWDWLTFVANIDDILKENNQS